MLVCVGSISLSNKLFCQFPYARMKVVIVGFGNSTQFFHAPLVLSSSSLDLFGVVSTKPKQTIQEKLGQEVVVFETFDKAIENVNEFDVVIIATPNEFHFPMAKTSMEKGKHVVIEKPLTVTTKVTVLLMFLFQLTPFSFRRRMN